MGLDVVEIILEIEEAFDIKIPDEAAEKIRTVGELYDYVVEQTCGRPNHSADNPPDRTDVCLTAATFYLVRRELCAKLGLDRRQVRPRTPLEGLFPQVTRRHDWAELGRKLDLEFPSLVRPRSLIVTAAALCLAMAAIANARARWPLAYAVVPLVLAASCAVAYWITTPLANRFPRSCTTIGDLCVSLLTLNYRRLIERFQCVRPSDVFQTIKLILVEQLGVNPALVTKEALLVNDLGLD